MESASAAHAAVGDVMGLKAMVQQALPLKYQMFNWPKLMAILSIPVRSHAPTSSHC